MAKTTFHTRYGLYKWTVLPMGLNNAPATFMWAMNNLFTDLLDHGIIVFLDTKGSENVVPDSLSW